MSQTTGGTEFTMRLTSVGLGTIYFLTSAIGAPSYTNLFAVLGFGNVSASAINVRDISNPDENHERIRTLVEVGNHL